jgi:Mn-dependent DtxR family transcriptional regulator
MTKEEKLLVIMAQLSLLDHGEPNQEVLATTVATKLGVTQKAFWNMFNNLARANFLRKDREEERVWLTPQGMAQVARLEKSEVQ